MEERKVAYSVTRYSGEETYQYKGIGNIYLSLLKVGN